MAYRDRTVRRAHHRHPNAQSAWSSQEEVLPHFRMPREPLRNVPNSSRAHRVFPGKCDERIRSEFMLLPLDFEFHLRWGRTAHFDDMANGESSLCRNPLPTRAWCSEFSDEFAWHFGESIARAYGRSSHDLSPSTVESSPSVQWSGVVSRVVVLAGVWLPQLAESLRSMTSRR